MTKNHMWFLHEISQRWTTQWSNFRSIPEIGWGSHDTRWLTWRICCIWYAWCLVIDPPEFFFEINHVIKSRFWSIFKLFENQFEQEGGLKTGYNDHVIDELFENLLLVYPNAIFDHVIIYFGRNQESTHRLVRTPLGASWCDTFRFLLVLVRCGPNISEFF